MDFLNGSASLPDWLKKLSTGAPALGALLNETTATQQSRGFHHTLREIAQQPLTWTATARLCAEQADCLADSLRGTQQIIVTGSGSSEYAGQCFALHLQEHLGVPVQSIAAGQLLTHLSESLPPATSKLLISLARSGDSPESCGVVQQALALDPTCRHLFITCNGHGRLAQDFNGQPSVRSLVLAPETCDRSLVMTSSFTNMVVAGWALAALHRLEEWQRDVATVARAGAGVLMRASGALQSLAAQPFRHAVFLASPPRFGAAREGALKMVESTAGRVRTIAETYLGLRHGPMSAVHDDTLVVCFLSADEHVRLYELDLISELDRKGISAGRLIVGPGLPSSGLSEDDVMVETGPLPNDAYAAIIDVLVGQLLAFFRSLHEGLHPDSPSADRIINRVVEPFPIYTPAAAEQE